MIALPIPGAGDLPPFVGVALVVVALAGFSVLVFQAVRYLRNPPPDNHSDEDKP